MENTNLPAYPTTLELRDKETGYHLGDIPARGLTKIEAFSMAAMQGLCSQPASGFTRHQIAQKAVDIATETLLELSKRNKE
jgi:hypothetical protein